MAISDWVMEEILEIDAGMNTTTSAPDLRAPFPWFGGKSRVAPLVWERFGDVPNYVEPFFGSGAVLLGRPHAPGTETVNDKDCYVANLWRALKEDPASLARECDWPVNECDLEARHKWLVTKGRREELRDRLKCDPSYYNLRIAGWWLWGISQWIGDGWCSGEWNGRGGENSGGGINIKDVERGGKAPHLGSAGKGVHRQLPHLGNAGIEEHLRQYFSGLAARLRRVRVCCGDWARVCGPFVTFKHGVTGVFLDPPYAAEADREPGIYSEDSASVAHEVREWAIENGDNPLLRIALCGYDGEHEMPESWECVAWKAHGGYGNQGTGRGRENAARERIWFSPHCLSGRQRTLFGDTNARLTLQKGAHE